jgi:alpha-tubulin suppressor-like RCC1 family protein
MLSGGTVMCWGWNHYGQLGDGTTIERLTPVAVSGPASGVQAIAAGGHHTCALLSGGGVKCWGSNTSGELGDGTTIDRSIPVAVSGLASSAQAISAGAGHTCALLGGGGVECWGYNGFGQLGDGKHADSQSPAAVTGLSSGVQAISAGFFHTCALLTSGAVRCWGHNAAGELGDGTITDRLTTVAVSGLASGARAISAGGVDHTCALLNTGAVECWGWNHYGQLGDGTTTEHHTPVTVSGLASGVQAIATGYDHTCALLNTGRVKCWGYNHERELGDGTTTNRLTPVAVSGLPSSVEAIAAGGGHTCALLSDGGFKCWGSNTRGQLGNGMKTIELDVNVRGHGTVSAPGFRCADECSTERAPGTRIVLTARPTNGWRLKNWSGGCKGRALRCTLVLNADATVTARFAKHKSSK